MQADAHSRPAHRHACLTYSHTRSSDRHPPAANGPPDGPSDGDDHADPAGAPDSGVRSQ